MRPPALEKAQTARLRTSSWHPISSCRRARNSTTPFTHVGSRVAVLTSKRAAPVRNATPVATAAISLSGATVGPALEPVDDGQQDEGGNQHHGRNRRCAHAIILLQFGDDDERRNLRNHRQVAGNEDHRPVFAHRARKSEGKSREHRSEQGRQYDAAHRLPPAGSRGWLPPPRSPYRDPPAPSAGRTAGPPRKLCSGPAGL